MKRTMRSEYMEWAKTCSDAKYNLASSDLLHFPLADLPVTLRDLEINGPGGYGYPPLLEALAGFNNTTTDCVVSSLGTSLANHIAMAAFIHPGDEVLMEEPTYELLLSTARYLGANVKRFPRRFENNFLIDAEDVRKAITPKTRLVILTNLHNPSSAYTDEATLKIIGEHARKVGAFVLVDEVYLRGMFDRTPPSAFHLGSNFVTTNSLTKMYGLSGLRCGWILAEPVIAKTMWRLTDLFHSTPAHIAELLSVVALKNIDHITRRARTLLETNTALLNRFFESRTDIASHRHTHGLVSFPRLNSSNVEIFSTLLRNKHETTIVPGLFFEMPQHFRLGIGKETAVLEEGLRRISSTLDEMSRKDTRGKS